MNPAHLTILATVATLGNMAIAHTLGHGAAAGLRWTIGQAAALAALYAAAVIATA